jgi:putative peptidoglycan lipid II flippase
MSENRQIARAAGLVGFFTLISRIAGLVRDAVVGYYFGTGMAADAFFIAFRIPNLLRRFVAEGAMSTAFIPVFTDYLTNRSHDDAVEAASALATIMAVLLALLTMTGIVFAPFWTSLFAPGFVEEPGKFALTVTLTRWVFPYVFLISLVALTSGMLNSLRHFAAPAMSPIFLNLVMIAAAIFVCPHLAQPVKGLAWGVVIGGVVQLGLQIPPLLRHGVRLVPLWEPGHEAVRRVFRLMAPTVFGAAVYQINVMVDSIFASVLPSGSVSYLWYAARVFEFPLGVFAMALGTAALPSFSAQAARGAHAELRRSLTFSMRLTNFIAMPAAVGIMTLAIPITTVLFRRGAFGFDQTVLTAQALSAFAVGLWSVAMVRLIVPAFYALQDTRTPVVTAATAFVVNCGSSLLLMGVVAPTGESRIADAIAVVTQHVSVLSLQHAGLALATSIAASVNLVLLAAVLRRRLGSLDIADLSRSFARSLVAALAMIPAVRYIAGLTEWSQRGQLLVHATVLIVAVGVGVLIYLLASFILGAEEVRVVTRLLRQRLLRPGAASAAQTTATDLPPDQLPK